MSASTLSKILFVEDEPDIQVVAKLALEVIGGFNVEICNNGNEAVQRAPEFAPQLIVLDVMMPGMDGPTTLKALRTIDITATTPIVFMTAKVQPHEVAYYREIGALDVIAKPFDPMTLSATINDIWSHYNG